MMENALAHRSKVLRRKETKHFYRLYDQVLDRLKNDAEIADEAISAILGSFNGFKGGDLNTWAKICAHLYRYGAHGAGLAGYRILEALENCARLRLVLDKRYLKVLSVGGGPFNDVIGFLSAMSQVDQWRMDNKQMFYNRKMDIRVSDDTSPLWNDVVKQTARLVREGEFGYVSQYSIYKVRSITFFHGTLPSNLHRYDVVIISKFINSLDHAEQFKLMRVSFFILSFIDTGVLYAPSLARFFFNVNSVKTSFLYTCYIHIFKLFKKGNNIK